MRIAAFAKGALRLARQYADAKDKPGLQAALKSAGTVAKYAGAASQVRTIYDPKQPPEARVRALGLNASEVVNQNRISDALRKTAVKAAVDTHRAAMNSLVQEVDRFSGRVAQQERTAISEAQDAKNQKTQLAIARTQ